MKKSQRFLGLNEFVEELSQHLAKVRLRSTYRSQTTLAKNLADATKKFLVRRLEPMKLDYFLYQRAGDPEETEGIEPIIIFGTHLYPDFVIEVADSPTVAVCVELVKGVPQADKVGAGLGRALACSYKYPAVISLIHHQGEAAEYMSLHNHEISADLWRGHKIRLLVR